MAAIDNNPLTTRLQQQNWFKFELKRAPALTYFAQKLQIPAIRGQAAEVANPYLTTPYVFDHLRFDPLNVTFTVDADFQNWLEIFNWMNSIGSSDGNTQRYAMLQNNTDPYFKLYSDVFCYTLDSQKNATYCFKFKRALPVALSGLQFDTTVQGEVYITSTVTFEYVSYSIDKLS
jgi:hypothetical protein